MNIKTLKFNSFGYPKRLKGLHSPPKQLFYLGNPPSQLLEHPAVAIVGSRRITNYGREITISLATELAKRGIVVISGLALGVDAVAQSAAIEAGGKVIAVLPGPVDNVLPRQNTRLASRIVATGGCLISEYPSGEPAYKQNFIARNRIVSGLAKALIITEAAHNSGSLHTARFALEIGQPVMAVPANINSPQSSGCNNLLKSGAFPLTEVTDVLHLLGLEDEILKRKVIGSNQSEQMILDLLASGLRDGADLQTNSGMSPAEFSRHLTMLEIAAKIRPLGANCWSIA